MAQISRGDTFTNGEQVSSGRLNQLVDAAQILVGAISEQTAMTASTVDPADTLLINDSGVLKKATANDILNSNIPVSTSSITGGSGVDLVVTPASGKKVDVGGAFEADSINSVGSASVGGNATVAGTLNVTGQSTLTGGVNGNFTVTGLITASTAPSTGSHLANKTYVDGTSSKATNGYVILPNGVHIQWGTTTSIAALTTQVQTFPVAFPNACLNVQATKITTNDYFGDRKDTHAVYAFTKTTFSMFNQHEQVSATYNWFAIGY